MLVRWVFAAAVVPQHSASLNSAQQGWVLVPWPGACCIYADGDVNPAAALMCLLLPASPAVAHPPLTFVSQTSARLPTMNKSLALLLIALLGAAHLAA